MFNLPCYSHGTSWVIYAVNCCLRLIYLFFLKYGLPLTRVKLLNFVQDVEQYNKLEDPTDEENDMLDLAFGLFETWVSYPSNLGT